jgi:hypothetical protein
MFKDYYFAIKYIDKDALILKILIKRIFKVLPVLITQYMQVCLKLDLTVMRKNLLEFIAIPKPIAR